MAKSAEYPKLDYETVVASLPKPCGVPEPVHSDKQPILVVLDDDPTGTQTVHDVTVVTTFDEETLKLQLNSDEKGFFILTNSRAYHDAEATTLLTALLTNLREAANECHKSIEVVLRSDSTLRGHFPMEPAIAELILGPFTAWVLAPAFFAGGRVTVNDVHYVREGASLIPVGSTPFAADKGFGFHSSNLHEWIAEKFKWNNTPRIESVTLEQLREENASAKIAARLSQLASEKRAALVIVLNAFSPSDMEVFVQSASMVPEAKLLYRTGASFVSARLAIAEIPPVPAQKLFASRPSSDTAGGLILIGSYVPKTTEQRNYLIKRCSTFIAHLELDVEKVLKSTDDNQASISDTIGAAEAALRSGKDVVISTSRKLITHDDGKVSLQMGSIVSGVLVEIVKGIAVRPKYVIAKGGITSSDVATKGLGIRRATVVGQAAVGVPLWRSQEGGATKWTDVPYIVFPGNVGQAETLGDLVASYRQDDH